MIQVDAELDRYVSLLREKIRRRGYTQLEVQQALGWGRSYVSQLVTKQKGLRVEHVLLILNVLGVDPAEFFGELYGWLRAPDGTRGPAPAIAEAGQGEGLRREIEELTAQLQGLLGLLVEKRMIDVEELTTAVQAERARPPHAGSWGATVRRTRGR